MPECNVCGEEDFECIDGLYYCTTCNTQSQHLRQEEQAEWVDTTFGLALRTSQSTEAVRKHRTQCEKGRPWETEEGFQIILMHQVEALIKLGASPLLKETVFALWKKYMKYTGTAFLDGKDCMELRAISNLRPRDRDLSAGTLTAPTVKAKRLQMSIDKLKAGTLTREGLKKKELEMTIGHEDFYEGDNPLADIVDTERTNMPFLPIEGVQMCRKAIINQINRLSLRTTVYLCYAGCLIIGEPVTAYDLFRWMEDHKLPFRLGGNCLPDDMTFSASDHTTFSGRVIPSPQQIQLYTGKLLKFLEISDLPHFNIYHLAIKYIIQLCLPRAEMIALVRHLMGGQEQVRVKHLSSAFAAIFPFESIAMAYIVFALKLLFVLNDVTEGKISEHARMISKVKLKPKLNVFVWDEWVRHMTSQGLDIKCAQLPINPSDTIHIRDVASCFKSEGGKGKAANKYCNRRGNNDTFQKDEVRGTLLKPVQSWLRENKDLPPPFPMTPSDEYSKAHKDSSGTESTLLESQGDHLARSTVRYLTDGDFLLKKLKKLKKDHHSQMNLVEELRKHQFHAGSNYVQYGVKEKVFHKSYQWLLTVCSDRIGSSTKTVHFLVQCLELKLFDCHDDLYKLSKYYSGMFPDKI